MEVDYAIRLIRPISLMPSIRPKWPDGYSLSSTVFPVSAAS